MSNDLLVQPQEVTSPPIVVGPAFHSAKVLDHSILTTCCHQFTLESSTPLVFKPGQYISIKVAENQIRDYSIACLDDPNKFKLLVDITPGGPGSHYFENLKVSDEIEYLGPFGVFTLQENDGAKHMLFLATGSGCSPLRSIIYSALKEKNIQTPMTLFFGLRYPTDIFWQGYFEQLSEEHPNFTCNITLSKPDQDWQGYTGHITDYLNKEYPDASGCSAYLCGNKEMIEEATNILLSNNCPKERIYTEKF